MNPGDPVLLLDPRVNSSLRSGTRMTRDRSARTRMTKRRHCGRDNKGLDPRVEPEGDIKKGARVTGEKRGRA